MQLVRGGLYEGVLTTVAVVFEGAAVVVEVKLGVDLIVTEDEDITGVETVDVTGVFEGFGAVAGGVDFIVILV